MVFEDVAFSVHMSYGLQWFRNVFCIMYFIETVFSVVASILLRYWTFNVPLPYLTLPYPLVPRLLIGSHF